MSTPWSRRPTLAAAAVPAAAAAPATESRPREAARSLRAPRPELLALLVLAAVLYLWALGRNGWANDYYSAAVRSMSSSWHNFLFASLDPSGVMTVDKPPLSLWVQSLSVRLFGFHPLSILIPQALMGVASVALVYDLVRRRFGRVGGFAAGLALALTPITVAVSRHNNPDALLVLCCVAAVWFAVRALEDGRTRWLVLAGICVGLGFETKMLVALTVVPGIALAWLWCTPAGRGRLHAIRQLLAGGAAMLLVGGAWPLLVELTPASQRPWVSGTSDNTILSLIFGYNGLGRVEGQAGGPGGLGGGTMFGGTPGPLRLLNAALGGQDGWLLGFAVVGGLAILLSSRLRRADARSGWLLIVGGAFATTAVLFSAAGGIFHPYYVSLLAPFTAALAGAGAVQMMRGGRWMRLAAVAAIAAGVAGELVVAGDYPGELPWLAPVLIVTGVCAAAAVAVLRSRRARTIAVAAAACALLLAPGVWAFDTLGHATSGTFPAGGPSSAAGGGFGGPGGGPPGASGRRSLFGGSGFAGGAPQGAGAAGAGVPPAGGGEAPGGAAGGPGAGAPGGGSGGPSGAGAPGGGSGGGFGQDGSLSEALAYARAHGGGTVAVSSQSSAASAIISSGADVAGIGGFAGRESDVTLSWLASEVAAGHIRWVLDSEGAGSAGGSGGGAPSLFGGAGSSAGGAFGGGPAGLPGDGRTGSRTAMAAVAKACTAVSLSGSSSSQGEAGGGTLYDCSGHSAQLLADGRTAA